MADNGFQPGQSPSDRRAAFDLRRQLRALEARAADLEQRLAAFETWAPYTPALAGAGWALGNGVLTGRAIITPARVDFAIKLVIGTTTTAGAGIPSFSLPVAADPFEWTEHLLRSSIRTTLADFTGGTYHGSGGYLSATTITPFVDNASGAYAADANVTGTVPVTFAVNDQIVVVGWYHPA